MSKFSTTAKAALLAIAILSCGFAAAPVGAQGRPTHTPTSHIIDPPARSCIYNLTTHRTTCAP